MHVWGVRACMHACVCVCVGVGVLVCVCVSRREHDPLTVRLNALESLLKHSTSIPPSSIPCPRASSDSSLCVETSPVRIPHVHTLGIRIPYTSLLVHTLSDDGTYSSLLVGLTIQSVTAPELLADTIVG